MPDAENADAVDSEDTCGLDNRAWCRLATVLGEHFDIVDRVREDGRRVLVSLVDPASGDLVTLAVRDSLEIRDPERCSRVTTEMGLVLHGTFDGDTAAAASSPRLVSSACTVAQTRPVRLPHPDQPACPERRVAAAAGRCRPPRPPGAGRPPRRGYCDVAGPPGHRANGATWTGQDRGSGQDRG